MIVQSPVSPVAVTTFPLTEHWPVTAKAAFSMDVEDADTVMELPFCKVVAFKVAVSKLKVCADLLTLTGMLKTTEL